MHLVDPEPTMMVSSVMQQEADAPGAGMHHRSRGGRQHIITEFTLLALPYFCSQFSVLHSPCLKYLEW